MRLLASISADVDRLEAEASRPGLIGDRVRLDAVKYRFVTAIEGSARVAHHVVASEGWGSPDSNADAVRLLAEHGVLENTLAQDMASASGFRNVLVHQYAEVDDPLVVKNLERLDELRAFVAQVAAWLRRQ